LSVINALRLRPSFNGTFTSHDFIGEYIKQNEHEYIEWLLRYWDTQNDTFRIVNAQIGQYLSSCKNDLSVKKAGKVNDTNVHGQKTENQEWSF